MVFSNATENPGKTSKFQKLSPTENKGREQHCERSKAKANSALKRSTESRAKEKSTQEYTKERQILRLATIEDSMNPPARSSLSIILIL